MAEVLVNLVVGKLCDVVLQEIFFLCGVNDKIEHVKRELNRIQCFLRDADCKRDKDQRVRNWVNELRGVSYWIEDTVDLFVMEIDKLCEKDPSVQKPGMKGKIKRIFKKPGRLVITHKFGKEIDKILARIDEISKIRARYGIENLEECSGTGAYVPFKRPILPDLDDTELVGVGAEKDKIIEQLLDAKILRRSVVSIVGTAGLGKSTVALKAYSSDVVKSQFGVRRWLSISQSFKPIDLFKKMLDEIRRLDDNEINREETYFMVEVNKILRVKKYLVVLDDVWSDDLWPLIAPVLPDVKNGSRVLITSRFSDVPKAAEPTCEPHQLRFLDEEESLQLLLKIAVPNRDANESCFTGLSNVATKLAKKCDGLPLALVVLGGPLSVKPPMHSVWEKVLNIMVWSVDGKKCMDILVTSYDDMSINLKSYFMYLACLSEDYKIDARDLIRLWVAEGLIPQIQSKTMEDTAEDYLEELAQRSMIQVSERSVNDNSIKFCQIHDLLHDLAIQKAKEDNFMTICSNRVGQQDCGGARRVAVHNFDSNELINCTSPNLRTLLCFNSVLPDCSRHRLLKVLYVMVKDSPETNDKVTVSRIEGLSQLRYLKLGDRNIIIGDQMNFEKSVSNMKFLQTLELQFVSLHDNLSDCIWQINTLRHVLLPTKFNLGPPPSTDLRNLQTLQGIKNRQSWKTTNLPKVPNLLVLVIEVTERFPWKRVIAFLCTLKKLVFLEIEGQDIPIEVVDMRGFPFYQHLTRLQYRGSLSCHDKQMSFETTMFPIHLTEITFCDHKLQQDHILVLEKLHGLKILRLIGAYSDQRMRCSAGGFPLLQGLTFSYLRELEEWEIEEGAMPMLKELSIIWCFYLEVPLSLPHLTTLHDLTWAFFYVDATKKKAIHDICTQVPSITIMGLEDSD